jgi:hypothetical protein
VADTTGAIVGSTEARPVSVPWWPETQSLFDTFADVLDERAAIVRLLDAERLGSSWHVTYLAQRGSEAKPTVELPSTAAPIATLLGSPSEQRMPWAELGGPAADLDWAVSELTALGLAPSGTPRQHKTWNLSSVWEIPIDRITDRRGNADPAAAWLKTTAPFGRHEAAVLRLLDGHPVPRLLAADQHRQLQEGMPGIDGFGASISEQLTIVDTLVDLQLATTGLLDYPIAAAIPDRRTSTLTTELTELFGRLALGGEGSTQPIAELTIDEGESLHRLIDGLEDRLAAIDDCGLPTVIVHNDAHPGNARIDIDTPLIFDWSDAFIGNPIWDLRRVLSDGDADQRIVRDHWLSRWAVAAPGSDPWRAVELSAPLSPLLTASDYQRFVDGIELSEQIYHRDDVGAELRLAARQSLPGTPPKPRLPE